MSATTTPNSLRFDLTPQQISDLTQEIISSSVKKLDEIVKISAKERTFINTVRALADVEGEFQSRRSNCDFPAHVSPNKEVRDMANEVANKLDAAAIEFSTREDLYKAVLEFQTEHPNEVAKLFPEEKRLLDDMLREFRRNGLALEPEKRTRVKEIKNKISELANKFRQNLTEDVTKLYFTKEQLKGMSDDFIDNLQKEEKEGGVKYVVTLKYPDLLPIMQHCQVEETRRAMDHANSSKCIVENTPLLEEIFTLRHEEANLLGYPSPSEYVLEVRMAKNVATVQQFLSDLTQRLEEPAQRDLARLVALKKEEKEKQGEPFDGKVNIWDWRYYENILLEREYQVEHEKIKEYFPLEKVTAGLLETYQILLGLRFVQLDKESRHVWHEDVEQYRVVDNETGDMVGHFYLDLFPRDGKYGHAAEFGLLQGFELPNGTRQYPAAAMVANFSKPTATKPSLLLFNEVETYFHEFGHVMHELCSRARFSRFAGTNVQRDFVEAPSQMLENWCYEPEVLRKLSGHYKEPSQTLPENLREKLIKAKIVNEAFKNRRQLFFGIYDITVHTSKPPIDSGALWAKLIKEVALTEAQPGTNSAAGFGHIVGGYESGYYGYLWSKVYSSDMFKKFKEEGVLNPVIGKKYRDVILSRGGTQDAMDLLKDFLGREPNQDAFLEEIGAK